MTNLSPHIWLRGAPAGAVDTPRFVRRLAEVAVTVVVVAALTGAWFALFSFVPFDFTPPRPG